MSAVFVLSDCTPRLGMGPGQALDIHTRSGHPRAELLRGSRGSVRPSLGRCSAEETPRHSELAEAGGGGRSHPHSQGCVLCMLRVLLVLQGRAWALCGAWGRAVPAPAALSWELSGCSARFTCSVPPGTAGANERHNTPRFCRSLGAVVLSSD